MEELRMATSKDGVPIGFWKSGTGPPLVLVHGAAGDHTRWAPLLPHLERHATVYAMDRRGRGASGDAPDYDIKREFEDVAAVIDAVAKESRSAVDVLGHSLGGACAMGAAPLTANLRKLVLYEGWPLVDPEASRPPAEVMDRLEALLARGDREEFLATFMREIVGMSDQEVAAYKARPSWQARIALAHTIPRELRAEPAFDPAQAAAVTVPTLMLVGGDSPPHLQNHYETVAAALPDARVIVLEGQQHIADVLVPEVFASHVVSFLRK